MDLNMLLRLQQQQQIYLLNAKHLYDYQLELNRYSICEQLEHFQRFEMMQRHQRKNAVKPLTSFKIQDILSKDENTQEQKQTSTREIDTRVKQTDSLRKISCDINEGQKQNGIIVRPWSISPRLSPSPSVETSLNNSGSVSEEEIDVEQIDDDGNKEMPTKPDIISPLDALMEMSNKAFKGLQDRDSNRTGDSSMLNKSQLPKKKRKTRTAFSNQQIYELEKRFLYQKYLTPTDRDEIANKLGLSCAQVITWFQNRRAKFKRDIEELKNDVGAVRPETIGDKSPSRSVRV